MDARQVIAAIGLALGCAGQAAGGAWPREPGSVFVSLGYEVTTSRRALRAEGLAEDPTPDVFGYQTLYAEIGLTPRLTFGLDIGGDELRLTREVERQIEAQARSNGADDAEIEAGDRFDAERVQTYDAVLFLQYAFGTPGAQNQYAARLGVGRRSYRTEGAFFGRSAIEEETILRPGLTYGRGFTSPIGPGWLQLDSSVEFRERTEGRVVKLDGTLGVRPFERLAYMIEVQTGDFPQAEPFAKVVPGVLLTVGEGVTLQSSLIYGVAGPDEVGLKLGLWLEF